MIYPITATTNLATTRSGAISGSKPLRMMPLRVATGGAVVRSREREERGETSHGQNSLCGIAVVSDGLVIPRLTLAKREKARLASNAETTTCTA